MNQFRYDQIDKSLFVPDSDPGFDSFIKLEYDLSNKKL